MFINKINGIAPSLGFKGYQNIKNDVGETIMKFNYPYDPENEICKVQIFRVKKTDKLNYVIDKEPITTFDLTPEGKTINLQKETNLDKNETFAYNIIRQSKKGRVIWNGADSGVKMHKEGGEYVFRVHNEPISGKTETVKLTDDKGNPLTIVKDGKEINSLEVWHRTSELDGPRYKEWQYTLVSQNGTTPFVQGPGYLAMPDTIAPGWRYKSFDEEGSGELIYDADYQKKMEGMVKTVSNMYGGSIAGLEAKVPFLKEQGIKKFFTTPIANGDNRTSHGYYNKNNMQIQDNLGTSENYDSLMKTEFKNGMNHVFDATLTSEGLEGIHVRYALRWGDKAQTSKWFRMSGLKDAGIGIGVVPNEAKNLRHRIINAPFNYERLSNGTYKAVRNEKYDRNKETLLQIYDASQVDDTQLNKLDEPIDMYRELNAGKNLDITTYDDTTICYVFEINPNEYQKNINSINDLIKNEKRNIELNSPEGTIIASNMSNFHINRMSDGYVAWDDNADMVKMNYGISAYDEKELQSIVDRKERQFERKQRITGSKEVQDMAVQVGIYWADKTKTAHTIYTAQTLGKTKSAENIKRLIKEGKLPEEVNIEQKVIDNILNGEYNLAPKCIMDKDDVTVKSLMKLPLDTLEFGENTVGVLSTSYFSNRATTDDTIGVSRFDLMKQNNPHLIDKYAKVYNKVNNMFENELKNFADDVIKKVNETSDEPLLKPDGNYTEYGEYVIELLGRNIAKYAMLKSLSGDSFKHKVLSDGTIIYDYKNIKKATTLKALGINAYNPTEEAEMLQKKILKGLKTLDAQDINNVAEAIKTTIKGTDTDTFRIAEALVERSGLGLDYRLDAAKDVMDMDSVRNRDADFNDVWTNLISFWSRYVQGVKSVNPHSYIVAEMTNVNDLSADTYGSMMYACPYNNWTDFNGAKYNGEPDAMTKFFNETGITSEAAYSYFFTELLTSFSKDFEEGTKASSSHDDFKKKYDLLINTRSSDYLRNLYTFIGNHDKTRTIHGLALDMELFHATLQDTGDDSNRARQHAQREKVIQVLSGAKNINEVPLELRLNVDNLDYFRTVSTRAVAQSKILMDSINEDLKGIASNEDIALLNEALIDLANGNYMKSKDTEKMTRINLAQISSIENAVNEIARLAEKRNIRLTSEEIKLIINGAKSLNLNNYLVKGDFDSDGELGNINKNYLNEIAGSTDNAENYSLYTIQIARMIKQAAKDKNINGLDNVLKDFVNTYNREKISQNMDGFKMYEDFATARKKNSYGAQDFRVALEEVINQAEYKSGRKIANKDEIIAIVYNSITEPAIKKQAMMLSFLGALCGIPTIYSGDEFGDTGFEDKAKNPNVRNRMASRLSEMDRNTLMGKIMKRNSKYTFDALRNKANIKPIQNGSSYSMDVMINGKNREELLTRIGEIEKIRKIIPKGSDLDKNLEKELNGLNRGCSTLAYMMQGADGRMAISVFNAADIEHNSRVNYFKKFNLHTDEEKEEFIKNNNIQRIENYNSDDMNIALNRNRKYNPYVPMQEKSTMDAILMGTGVTIPIGTIFYNICNKDDKTEYIVKKIKDKIGIVRADGKKIVMDGLTAKHGVMMLTNFRGRPKQDTVFNKQYNIAPKSYKMAEKPIEGNKLSVIAK